METWNYGPWNYGNGNTEALKNQQETKFCKYPKFYNMYYVHTTYIPIQYGL